MNNQLQSRLDTLTTNLNLLVDSITTYNPSPAAAATLLHEDALLSADLETLATHQANHATLERLRATTQQLDTQIKDSLRTLAETRKELISQRPPKNAAVETDAVDVNELLEYARRIARYTNPPRNAQKPVVQPTAEPEPESQMKAGASMNANTQSTELAMQTQSDVQNTHIDLTQSGAEQQEEVQTPTTRTRDKLPEHLHAWIDPPQGADGFPIWTPWPNENVIKKGALGRIQRMVEAGVDPGTAESAGQGGASGEGAGDGADATAGQGKEPRVITEQQRAEYERRREEARRKAEEDRKKQAEAMDEFDLDDDE